MNKLYVAYNDYGDLVAEGHSYSEVLRRANYRGYEEDELFIGVVTP